MEASVDLIIDNYCSVYFKFIFGHKMIFVKYRVLHDYESNENLLQELGIPYFFMALGFKYVYIFSQLAFIYFDLSELESEMKSSFYCSCLVT